MSEEAKSSNPGTKSGTGNSEKAVIQESFSGRKSTVSLVTTVTEVDPLPPFAQQPGSGENLSPSASTQAGSSGGEAAPASQQGSSPSSSTDSD